MKLVFLFCILMVGNVYAQTALSLRFGSTTIDADDHTTYGTGLQLQGETFLDENYGIIFALGQSNTESSTNVTQDGTSKPALEVSTSFLNLGAFYYITEPFRVSAGISSNYLEVTSSDSSDTTTSNTNILGPFASASYMLRLDNFALGLEYFYSRYGEYSQSNLILILGLAF